MPWRWCYCLRWSCIEPNLFRILFFSEIQMTCLQVQEHSGIKWDFGFSCWHFFDTNIRLTETRCAHHSVLFIFVVSKQSASHLRSDCIRCVIELIFSGVDSVGSNFYFQLFSTKIVCTIESAFIFQQTHKKLPKHFPRPKSARLRLRIRFSVEHGSVNRLVIERTKWSKQQFNRINTHTHSISTRMVFFRFRANKRK